MDLSQANCVANLPDGSEKFSQRNPKMDFRENPKNSIDKCRKFAYNKEECGCFHLQYKSEKRSSKSNSHLR